MGWVIGSAGESIYLSHHKIPLFCEKMTNRGQKERNF